MGAIYLNGIFYGGGSGGGGGALPAGGTEGQILIKNSSIEGDASQKDLDADEIANIVSTSEKGAANGIATLDENSQVPTTQLPEISINGVDLKGEDTTFEDLGLNSITSAELSAMQDD